MNDASTRVDDTMAGAGSRSRKSMSASFRAAIATTLAK